MSTEQVGFVFLGVFVAGGLLYAFVQGVREHRQRMASNTMTKEVLAAIGPTLASLPRDEAIQLLSEKLGPLPSGWLRDRILSAIAENDYLTIIASGKWY